MTTATENRQTAPTTTPDFETRLALANIAMDVALSRHAETSEASAESAAAIFEAQAIGPVAEAEAKTFRSNPILKRAGDIIRERGWTQLAWEDAEGGVCLVHAIRTAAYGSGGYSSALAEVRARIAAGFGDRGWSASGWNDRSDRTVDEVLSVLY